jgi:hypothetical protein
MTEQRNMGRIAGLQNEIAHLQSVLAQRNDTIAGLNRQASKDAATIAKGEGTIAELRAALSAKTEVVSA